MMGTEMVINQLPNDVKATNYNRSQYGFNNEQNPYYRAPYKRPRHDNT